jgi:hypothetical protein
MIGNQWPVGDLEYRSAVEFWRLGSGMAVEFGGTGVGCSIDMINLT